MSGILYGVGAGPGDPELLTIKALHVLQAVDLIVIIDSGSSSSLNACVKYFNLADKVHSIAIPMTKNQSVLDKAYIDAFEHCRRYLDQGMSVAHLVLGDISLYASFTKLLRLAQEQSYSVEIIPGITSASAGAAKAQVSLAKGDEELRFVSALNKEKIDDALASNGNIVFYKAKRNFLYLLEKLKELDLLDQAYVFEKLGMPGEKLSFHLDQISAPQSYFTSVFVRTYKPREDK